MHEIYIEYRVALIGWENIHQFLTTQVILQEKILRIYFYIYIFFKATYIEFHLSEILDSWEPTQLFMNSTPTH